MNLLDAALCIDPKAFIEPVLAENGAAAFYVYQSDDIDADLLGMMTIDEGPRFTEEDFDAAAIKSSIAYAREAWKE